MRVHQYTKQHQSFLCEMQEWDQERNFFLCSISSMDCGYIAFSCKDVYPDFSLFYSAQSVVVVHPEEHPVTEREKEEQCSAAWSAQGKERLLAASARELCCDMVPMLDVGGRWGSCILWCLSFLFDNCLGFRNSWHWVTTPHPLSW